MRILIDECVPRKLKRSLPGYDCCTVPEAGLAGNDNGDFFPPPKREVLTYF